MPQIDVDFINLAERASQGSHVLRSESDRGCALVAASMLDSTLASVLRCFFIDEDKVVDGLLDQGRPLATFSSRVDTARAIGLISHDLYADLHVVRRIRNAAAHFDGDSPSGHEFRFLEQSVTDRCRALANCPPEIRDRLPPRLAFELFVGMVSAVFAEYARNARILNDHGMHSTGRRMLLDLLPTVDFRGHLQKATDALQRDSDQRDAG